MTKKILGIGAALVDVLANVSEEWMAAQGVQKGGMNHVDWPQMEKFLGELKNPIRVPGGSTCNTMVGISKLGGDSAFISRVGDDELGRLFQNHLKSHNVENRMGLSDVATGCVFSAVTPDAQRSMWTFLGASNDMKSEDFCPELFDGVSLILAEGYSAFDTENFKKCFTLARSLGVETALDFSSFGVVDACRGLFDELFEKKMIDIVIANEDEAFAYAGVKEEAALEVLAKKAKVAVVKIGKRGALIAKDGVVTRVEAGAAKAIDTTGAGDLWAAGFLYGYMNGWDMDRAGKLGSVVSNEVVQVMGAMIPEEGWKRIKSTEL
ncbi:MULTISPECIES: adenosine kinase [unclassified Fibrobacter]|uniref:adenosine kinase n=1 Tax=unclassified Fibrobacter TaxID=2634177 RepID=UPI000923CFB0|nr:MULTISPECIES: adenosine kinase [unclassified Fibrobacter]OWV08276.1 adenosine kinase [Fibrobacter sp. UWH3]SHL21331.1 Sugar or nucleoside kinase, ribokinase family [Fibrobacter sp. UWH6]